MQRKRPQRRLDLDAAGGGGNETDEYMFNSQQDDREPRGKPGEPIVGPGSQAITLNLTGDKKEDL